MKKGKTKYELHKEKKRELAESIEYLRQVDLPEAEGGGSKFVRDTRKEEKREEKKKDDAAKNYLESRINQQHGYRDRIASYALQESISMDVTDGWDYYCVPTSGERMNIFGKYFKTQEGVIHILRSKKGNVYIRAVGITYDPDIDVKNVHTMLEQAINTIDSEKGILLSDNKDTAATYKKSESGLILPN